LNLWSLEFPTSTHQPTPKFLISEQESRQTNMPRVKQTTHPARRPGIMDRLRRRPARTEAKVTTKHSTNPITGTHKTTRTTETHPQGLGHHGHGGRGPMASNRRTHHTHTAAPVHHQRRKPSMGDKVSGAMMKLQGSLTRKPGKKVCCL
jgi:hypothetical protein